VSRFILKIHLYSKDISDPSGIWKYKKSDILVTDYLKQRRRLYLRLFVRIFIRGYIMTLRHFDVSFDKNLEPAPDIILPPFPANFYLIHNPDLLLDSTGHHG
jgi:hypothetical protein